MQVLLTGGAGYIGSHTLVELLGRGDEVCVVDNHANSSPVALDRVRALTGREVLAHKLDIRDTDALTCVCQDFRPEAVIHFAGLKAVGEGQTIPLDYYDVNVAGTVSLLRAMDRSDCRRIAFSSSATVYGLAHYLPYDEDHPLAPTNVYGHTKRMAEQVITDWSAANPGTAAVLLRYFNPAGAHASGQIGEDPCGVPNNLVPFVSQVAAGRRDSVAVFGDDYDTPDGTGVRDYIHVVDLALAHVAALDLMTAHRGLEAINIGTGRGYSVLEVIEAFGRACGRPIPHSIAPRRSGDIATSLADPGKAHRLLGWSAGRGLDDMCQSAWVWQSGNPDGYAET